MRICFWLALWAGKTTANLMKLLGKKGTTFPGLVACKIYPKIIGALASSFGEGIVIITGTNGKTTTNNLFASILKQAGKKIAFNREGANMLTGIAGVLLQNTSYTGRPQAELLVLEVDEATVPGLCLQVRPDIAVITNFFRDQLDRYGELDTTIRLVKEALPPNTALILNADDPLVAQIGTTRSNVYYYGVECLPVSKKESSETREGRYCAHCGHELSYDIFHYGQLGIYTCQNCGLKRPAPYVQAQAVSQEDSGIVFWIDEEEYRVPLQGYYNLYNALAAICTALRLGIDRKNIRQGLMNFVSDAGRMEQFALSYGNATLTLVKNPTGFNQVINTLAELNRPLRMLIAINDLAADGRDISWLWDVDFEVLASCGDNIKQVVCAGLRAEDMALRLKYAGVEPGIIIIEHTLEKAVEILEKSESFSNESVFILPTYTVLFPMREILVAKSR